MISGAMTLKDKRRIVKSVKDRISHEFNVSIAEVGALDAHRKAIIGVSMVGNESRFIRECLDKILKHLKMHREAVVVDYQIDLV